MIVRKGDEVAFVLRSNTGWMDKHYGLPSGKVEKTESFVQAALREVKEEIGIKVNQEDMHPIFTLHRYEPSSQASYWVDVYFEAKQWAGQPINNEPQVHSELAWFTLNKLPKNVIPSLAFALSEIKRGKSYSEYGFGS